VVNTLSLCPRKAMMSESNAMNDQKLTWKDVVAGALQQLGGQAHLSEINELVEGHPKTATNPTWPATIRRVVRQYKIFQPVAPRGSGVYRLARMAAPQPQLQNLPPDGTEMSHGIAQGMLVTLGNVYGYETFAPAHDQTTRSFQGKELADLVTVTGCNSIFRGPNLSNIREIDVLWFDEDDHGLFPVYAFEVEHTTRVKSGMDRLLKIPRRFAVHFFVIAPTEREQALFDHLINQTPFRSYRDNFTFRLYNHLQAVYDAAVRHNTERESFGLTERCRRV